MTQAQEYIKQTNKMVQLVFHILVHILTHGEQVNKHNNNISNAY